LLYLPEIQVTAMQSIGSFGISDSPEGGDAVFQSDDLETRYLRIGGGQVFPVGIHACPALMVLLGMYHDEAPG
jgi:hypothetical protein